MSGNQGGNQGGSQGGNQQGGNAYSGLEQQGIQAAENYAKSKGY